MKTNHTKDEHSNIEDRVETYAKSYEGILSPEVIERSKQFWRKELLEVKEEAVREGHKVGYLQGHFDGSMNAPYDDTMYSSAFPKDPTSDNKSV